MTRTHRIFSLSAAAVTLLAVPLFADAARADSGKGVRNEQKAGSFTADNTGRNARDKNDYRLTADDQPASSDIDVLARVRRAIVARDDLSLYAKNVKIIVTDGTVTLRGPVRSQAEADAVGAEAKKAAPGYAVLNDVEVTAAE